MAGDALAQYVGARYLLNLAKDSPEHADSAVSLLRDAADQGLAVAQGMLGSLHDDGFGPIKKNSAEADRWLRLAADQGLVETQTMLARKYSVGIGVPKDAAEAVYWYRRAAEQGEVQAQIMLAAHYDMGDGTPKDVVRAYAWISVAAAIDADAEVGGERIADVRDIKADHLAAGQLEEGTRLAHELWSRLRTPRHPLMIQSPFPTGDARELRMRVLAALGVEAEMPPEPAEFKTWVRPPARVFRRLVTPQEER